MSAKTKFTSVSGMRDILPEDQKYFQKICCLCEEIAGFYGFKKIDTPILENVDLYEKGTGLSTDIVQKQMFSLRTKGGDYLALRPEFTPGIIRAYLEHGMSSWPQPVKLYSIGPAFRYERPQAGRYRQFYQFNLEVVGEASPAIDAEIIQIFYSILNEVKLKNVAVEVNSIGDNQCRPYYKKLLVSYFKSRNLSLCHDCRRRLKENPLRILDCKEEKCRKIIGQAPQIIDHLCENCHHHFKSVLEFLDEIELPYQLNPYLVRGLDYYTKTVFEMAGQDQAEEMSGSVLGGGRYDLLAKLLGGEATPASGGALGVDRLVHLMKKNRIKISVRSTNPPIFIAQLGMTAKTKGLKLLEEFRKNKIQAVASLGRDSLKAQLKMADKFKVKYALLLGQKEVLEGSIIIRDMQTGRQKTVQLDKVVKEIKKSLKK